MGRCGGDRGSERRGSVTRRDVLFCTEASSHDTRHCPVVHHVYLRTQCVALGDLISHRVQSFSLKTVYATFVSRHFYKQRNFINSMQQFKWIIWNFPLIFKSGDPKIEIQFLSTSGWTHLSWATTGMVSFSLSNPPHWILEGYSHQGKATEKVNFAFTCLFFQCKRAHTQFSLD